jgi:phosphomannomutase
VGALSEHPPLFLGGVKVSNVVNLAHGYDGFAPTDGVLLKLGDTGRVIVRPSGTEAKLKAYIEVTSPPSGAATLQRQRNDAAAVVSAMRSDLEVILKF